MTLTYLIVTLMFQIMEGYGDLEKLTEKELMQILKNLEEEEKDKDVKSKEPEYQLFNFTNSKLEQSNSTEVSVLSRAQTISHGIILGFIPAHVNPDFRLI